MLDKLKCHKVECLSFLCLLCLIIFFLYTYFLPVPRLSDQYVVFSQFINNSFLSSLPTIGLGNRFTVLAVKDLFFLPYIVSNIEEACLFMFILQTVYLTLFFYFFYMYSKTQSNRSIAILTIIFMLFFANQTDWYFVTEFGFASEISTCMYLSAFILLCHQAQKTNKSIFYIAALAIALFLPYAKETYFIILFILSFFKLLFMYRAISKKEKNFHIIIIILCIVYIFNYIMFAFNTSETSYTEELGASFYKSLHSIIHNSKFFIISVLILVLRIIYICMHKITPIESDYLLLSSVAFISSYIILGLPQYAYSLLRRIHNHVTYVSCVSLIFIIPTFMVIHNSIDPIAEKERNISVPIIKFFTKLETIGHPYIAFTPLDSDLFIIPFHKTLGIWKCNVFAIFEEDYVKYFYHHNMIMHKKMQFYPKINNPNLYMYDESTLKMYLDDGCIAIVPDYTNKKFFYQTDPMYGYLDFYWCKVAYNKNIEDDVKMAMGPMLQEIQENAGKTFLSNEYLEFIYLALDFGYTEKLLPDLTKNFSELERINTALQEYFKKYQHYPQSEGFQGVQSQWGASKGEIWIDGLVPEFIDSLPQGNGKEFLYCSDGLDYKLLVHLPENFYFISKIYPDRVDPMRNSYAAGFWTKNATQW